MGVLMGSSNTEIFIFIESFYASNWNMNMNTKQNWAELYQMLTRNQHVIWFYICFGDSSLDESLNALVEYLY